MINGAYCIINIYAVKCAVHEMCLDDNYYGKLIPSKTDRGQ